VRGGSEAYGATTVLDGNLQTYWAPGNGVLDGHLEVVFDSPRTFDVIRLQEPIHMGQRVAQYHVEVQQHDEWTTIVSGTTIGHKKLDRLGEPVTTDRLRLFVDDALAELSWEDVSLARIGSKHDQLDIHSSAQLVITLRGKVRAKYMLNMPSYIVGRSDDCSIVIRSRYLSRHHALLMRDAQGWMIQDLKSTNGVSVNGRDVHFARLTDRDIIGIGEFLCRFSLHKRRETVPMPTSERTDMLQELPDISSLSG
jgi:hypothetical protein